MENRAVEIDGSYWMFSVGSLFKSTKAKYIKGICIKVSLIPATCFIQEREFPETFKVLAGPLREAMKMKKDNERKKKVRKKKIIRRLRLEETYSSSYHYPISKEELKVYFEYYERILGYHPGAADRLLIRIYAENYRFYPHEYQTVVEQFLQEFHPKPRKLDSVPPELWMM